MEVWVGIGGIIFAVVVIAAAFFCLGGVTQCSYVRNAKQGESSGGAEAIEAQFADADVEQGCR